MTLDLILKTKWFNIIKSGEKTEEYRDIKPFYINRLFIKGDVIYLKQTYPSTFIFYNEKDNFIKKIKEWNKSTDGNCLRFRPFKEVKFHKGYTNETITFEIEDIKIGYGKEEWGAEKDKEYFIIKLGKRIN